MGAKRSILKAEILRRMSLPEPVRGLKHIEGLGRLRDAMASGEFGSGLSCSAISWWSLRRNCTSSWAPMTWRALPGQGREVSKTK